MTDDDLICDDCGDSFDPACGCLHNGKQLCPVDLTHCVECLDAIQADSWEN